MNEILQRKIEWNVFITVKKLTHVAINFKMDKANKIYKKKYVQMSQLGIQE